jgi:hypothetical protein
VCPLTVEKTNKIHGSGKISKDIDLLKLFPYDGLTNPKRVPVLRIGEREDFL